MKQEEFREKFKITEKVPEFPIKKWKRRSYPTRSSPTRMRKANFTRRSRRHPSLEIGRSQ